MHIAKLRLKNWGRYEGEHEIELKPIIYGVVARLDGDEERSNWLGKSLALEAVRFALYGEHRFRTEDEWIARGQPDGYVELVLADDLLDASVKRSRTRGKSTQLELRGYHRDVVANQEAAQKLVEKMVGMGPGDFANTCWFGQKQMARFVQARPSERMEVVSAWLGLDALRDADARARRHLAGLLSREEKIARRLAVVDGREAEVESQAVKASGAQRTGKPTDEQLREQAEQLERTEQDASAAIASLEARREEVNAWVGQAAVAEEHDRALDELAKNSDDLARHGSSEEKLAALRREGQEIGAVERVAMKKVEERRRLAAGKFDGRCPLASIECPARDAINRDRAGNAELLAEAEAEHREKNAKLRDVGRRIGDADEEDRKARTARAKAEQLRRQVEQTRAAKTYIDRHGSPPKDATKEINDKVEEKRRLAHDAHWKRASILDVLESRQELEQTRGEVQAERRFLAGELAAAREAVAVLGPGGAQRRVAEGELARIESGANALLADAGIDLRVSVRWGRETKGLAKACSACGQPFPSSARERTCARCGGERGNQVEERLDLELSDRSGAAEDLAGVAFELSAAAWLRARRGVAWSVALIDEPFSALDAGHRRALSHALQRMLRSRYGFEQAFIVSHTSDVDDYPGRVIIRADGARSRMEVES